jgi:hypothetical protein
MVARSAARAGVWGGEVAASSAEDESPALREIALEVTDPDATIAMHLRASRAALGSIDRD